MTGENVAFLKRGVAMRAGERGRVLDVGQCGLDHASIRSLVAASFDADVDRARSIEDALAAMRKGRYDLVLVNRVIDADGRDGMELLRQAREDAQVKDVPIMLVSDYPDAQAAAVAAGARAGFGKAGMFERTTRDRLAEFLPRKADRG